MGSLTNSYLLMSEVYCKCVGENSLTIACGTDNHESTKVFDGYFFRYYARFHSLELESI